MVKMIPCIACNYGNKFRILLQSEELRFNTVNCILLKLHPAKIVDINYNVQSYIHVQYIKYCICGSFEK